MKIAVVSDIIYPWNKGGAELRYLEIYKRLAKRHEVHYFTMKHPSMKNVHFDYEGMKVHAVQNAPRALYKDGRRVIIPAITFSINVLKELGNYSFDIIDVNETPFFPIITIWIYRLLNPRSVIVSVWHEHWSLIYWQEYLGFIKGSIGFLIQQLSTRLPDLIIPVSIPTKLAIQRIGKRKKGISDVILNGIDETDIETLRKKIRPIRGRIIFVGRHIAEKRVDLFINLIRKLGSIFPHASGVIVGDGPERDRLERLAHGCNIQFTGFIENHKDVLIEIAKSWSFVSFSEREGFNISALEACQLGVPTFVRQDYFDHANQHVISKESTKAFLELLQAEEITRLDLDKRYTWKTIATQTEGVFLHTLNVLRNQPNDARNDTNKQHKKKNNHLVDKSTKSFIY